MVDQLKLVPLRIPCGWKIEWNIFTEVNPNEFFNDDYDYKWEFNEDILYMVYGDELYGLDLGWYPEFNSDGEYCLKIIKDNDWEQTIDEFRSRNINEIKDKIESFWIYIITVIIINKINKILFSYINAKKLKLWLYFTMRTKVFYLIRIEG